MLIFLDLFDLGRGRKSVTDRGRRHGLVIGIYALDFRVGGRGF